MKKATPKQIFARKRNWEKGQLMGMVGNLHRFETLSNTERKYVEAITRRLQAIVDNWEIYNKAAKRTSKLGRMLKLW